MLSGTPFPEFCATLGDGPFVAGVDEAGRGPLAGPVVAAAVVLCNPAPDGLGDSKKLSAKRRASLEATIRETCAFRIGVVDVETIDRLNILAATMLAMSLAMEGLCAALGEDRLHTLIDGNLTPEGRCDRWRWSARAIVGGDGKEAAIGAASILAKEYRDRLMVAASADHPEYGWDSNKGYGSKTHMEALRLHGPTPLHRRSFAPVSQMELPV
ncbi:ribonuclease HII [Aurantiacibacter gangjinensis]|uniref:Ribonuclease HII n=1 Tax=Aurantiacibacter gangjinensis TaxID=502682 RepID=A0A0G9MRA8_9SPHN|nr:ribonuclease HII [Aurantiacibacter gangjinensis]KLE33240.1 ribonuclease HII [Aurantiacibacter gangjinensis]